MIKLVTTEDLVIILPICLGMTLTICYTLLYVFGQTGLSKQFFSHCKWDVSIVVEMIFEEQNFKIV